MHLYNPLTLRIPHWATINCETIHSRLSNGLSPRLLISGLHAPSRTRGLPKRRGPSLRSPHELQLQWPGWSARPSWCGPKRRSHHWPHLHLYPVLWGKGSALQVPVAGQADRCHFQIHLPTDLCHLQPGLLALLSLCQEQESSAGDLEKLEETAEEICSVKIVISKLC